MTETSPCSAVVIRIVQILALDVQKLERSSMPVSRHGNNVTSVDDLIVGDAAARQSWSKHQGHPRENPCAASSHVTEQKC